jgi:hypothetical protein
MTNYYENQINRIRRIAREHADIKLQNDQGETHWMRITPSQIDAILEILKENEGATHE